MLGRLYERENCSAARTLEVIGERWSVLIVRNALYAGATRFAQFQSRLGIATNVLTARLELLVDNGILERLPRAEDSEATEYVLTDRGRELEPVILALSAWGDRWSAPDGPPMIYRHDDCDGAVELAVTCRRCHQHPPAGRIHVRPGPGWKDDPSRPSTNARGSK